MTKEDIIRMAWKAGGTEMEPYDYGARPDRFIMRHEVLDHFAALVAAAEREACARVCEQMPELEHGWRVTLPSDCAAAIRARRNT